MKFVDIDFEFSRSSEKQMRVVCAALKLSDHEDPDFIEKWWLDGSNHVAFNCRLTTLRKKGYIFYGYQIGAEARAMMSLNMPFDPATLSWIDGYSEWRQLTYNNEELQYGRYFSGGREYFSVPPSYDATKNRGKNNTEVGKGYAAAVGRLLGICVDSFVKDRMRNLVISDPESYTEEEKQQLMDYCADDVRYLTPLREAMDKHLMDATGLDNDGLRKVQLLRGEYAIACAEMEQEGIPVCSEYIKNLGKNYQKAKNTIIEKMVSTYPFYTQEPVRKDPLRPKWTFKYSQFEKFLIENNLTIGWPLSEKSGKYKTDSDTLDEYSGVSEIEELRQTMKTLKQLDWLRPDGAKNILENLGSDNRLRVFLAPFGTQTGRNAPAPKKGYIPAMANWLRVLMKPPENHTIIAIDYASQEFAIAAVMSEDSNMIEAYRSGDPYLYFAKLAGAVPPEGTKDEYPEERDLFKSTTLGLQYGMGAKKLAIKLKVDTGKEVTENDARKLINLHKKAYPKLWSWKDKMQREYDRYGSLILWDGWALLGDNDNAMSVQNFPIQGTGAVILKRAVKLMRSKGLKVLFPLHDAMYTISSNKNLEENTKVMGECMKEAVREVIGDKLEIRLDVDHHGTEDWVEGKGRKFYEVLNKYLHPIETVEDMENELFSILDKFSLT